MGKFLDAALNGAAGYAGKAYFFKGAKYVRYDWTKEQGDPGYPLGLDEWGFLPPFDKGIDAAIEGREAYEKKAFFFKDDKYLRYDWTGDGKVDSGYPKSIDAWELPAGFFTGKKKIDAAINGAGEYAGYCYLFSGTNWVRIDWREKEEPVLHKGGFPGDWDLPGEIAKGIDAALSGWGKKYGNKAYFFRDQKYARFDWSADKCDLKNGDLGAWKTSWDNASPAQQKGGAMGKETWTFKNGGGTELKAFIEKDDKGEEKLTFEMFDDKLKKVTATIPIDTGIDAKTKVETHGQPKKTQTNAYAAYAILYWFGDKKREKKYGDRVTFEADGRLIVGLFEEHPADAGIHHPHPGCSLLDAGPIKR